MSLIGSWRCLWALYVLNLFFSISSATQKPLQTVIDAAPKRVAVIGAGAGGSFAAYELRKLADASGIPVNVTVFERASYIGGRSTTVDAFDDPAYPIELGASIFVEVNQILMNASYDLGLFVLGADYARPKQTDDSIGIWDGSKFVFTVQDTSSWWNIAKLFWRYGLAPLRTQNLMKEIVGRFLKLYEEPMFPFRSLSEAAIAVNLVNVTASPGDAFLNANSISESFAREIIQASTRVNYGQNLALIHGLESMVCMATDGAVSVHGGNWRIFDGVLKAAKTEVRLNTTVTNIVRSKEGTVRLTSKPTSDLDSALSDSDESEFDEVIIAGPLQYSGISISPPLERVPDDIPYAKLHVTLLASPHRISSQFFGLDDKISPPETILTTLPEGLDLGTNPKGVGPAGFWSVSTLQEVPRIIMKDGKEQHEDHYVYKIFSPERPTADFIAELFGIDYSRKTPSSEIAGLDNTTIADLPKSEVSWFHEKVWHPYPLMYPRVTFEEVLLAPSVWYTSGIESFISTMETSALMGRNVAALMVQSWQREKDERDDRSPSTGRTEL